ncbi:hypothetical protein [Amycolatopsis dendrobii]|uniref:Uncharacterized protein n=1 Tax=Amycolatopsis dendrobii TaxID=2760662 RepID=A0A7W3VVI8_9PSEU|nr:hypothetical protein [Amycolatopsis dendrobii]MBB1154008.1 hypothetical protein [Amycolatopsis dendrobii]
MSTFAFPKLQYAVWDGTNVAEIGEFVHGAFVAADGSLQYPGVPGMGVPITSDHGVYVVGTPGGVYPIGVFATEVEFLAAYSPVSN